MKITFMGCGASEGIPAIFCNCKLCSQARERKIFRTRSQLLINKDLLIDFSPDSYYRSISMGVCLSDIENILITHSHSDHFYPEDFFSRGLWSSFRVKNDTLTIHCNKQVRSLLEKTGYVRRKGQFNNKPIDLLNGYDVYERSAEYQVHSAFETFSVKDYEITVLPANHIKEEDCFIYLIKQNGKCLLYATDTGFFFDSVFDYLKDNGIVLDALIADGTYGLVRCDDKAHMDFYENDDLLKKLKAFGIVNKDTKCYLTHVCHVAAMDLDSLEKAVPSGYTLPYDGYTFEI